MRGIFTAALAVLCCGSAAALPAQGARALHEAHGTALHQVRHKIHTPARQRGHRTAYRKTHCGPAANPADLVVWGYHFTLDREPPASVGIWAWGHHFY